MLLAINTSRAEPASLALPISAERYTLAAVGRDPRDALVRLNGAELALRPNDELLDPRGSRAPPRARGVGAGDDHHPDWRGPREHELPQYYGADRFED